MERKGPGGRGEVWREGRFWRWGGTWRERGAGVGGEVCRGGGSGGGGVGTWRERGAGGGGIPGGSTDPKGGAQGLLSRPRNTLGEVTLGQWLLNLTMCRALQSSRSPCPGDTQSQALRGIVAAPSKVTGNAVMVMPCAATPGNPAWGRWVSPNPLTCGSGGGPGTPGSALHFALKVTCLCGKIIRNSKYHPITLPRDWKFPPL